MFSPESLVSQLQGKVGIYSKREEFDRALQNFRWLSPLFFQTVDIKVLMQDFDEWMALEREGFHTLYLATREGESPVSRGRYVIYRCVVTQTNDGTNMAKERVLDIPL